MKVAQPWVLEVHSIVHRQINRLTLYQVIKFMGQSAPPPPGRFAPRLGERFAPPGGETKNLDKLGHIMVNEFKLSFQ